VSEIVIVIVLYSLFLIKFTWNTLIQSVYINMFI